MEGEEACPGRSLRTTSTEPPAAGWTPPWIACNTCWSSTIQGDGHREEGGFGAALPVLSEGDGTWSTWKAAPSGFFQVYAPAFTNADIQVRESWRWLDALQGSQQPRSVRWNTFDDVESRLRRQRPLLTTMGEAAPNAGLRIRGMKLAREPHRYSGRTSMLANQNVSEARVARILIHRSPSPWKATPVPALSQVPFAWAPGWNSPPPGTSSRTRGRQPACRGSRSPPAGAGRRQPGLVWHHPGPFQPAHPCRW